MTGERVPHPDEPEGAELYDLLVLADGPWNERRMRTSSARVIEARHWIEFVRSLRDGAVADLESTEEQLDDSAKARSHATRGAAKLV